MDEKKIKRSLILLVNWKEEILFMRIQKATLKKTIKYIFMEDKELEKHYKNREKTAITLLSKYIRSLKKKESKKASSVKNLSKQKRMIQLWLKIKKSKNDVNKTDSRN